MFNFFLPSKTKQTLSEAELIYSNLQRNRIYSQDNMRASDIEAVTDIESRYPALIKARDADGLEKLNKEALKIGNKLFPPSPWDGWRENVEVFVVAAIMALAIRTFFLQPFKIPTGSMEPTLLGIEPVPTAEMPPGLLNQVYEFAIHGKTYSRVVTKNGGRIAKMQPGSFTIWLEYTDLTLVDAQGNTEVDRIWIREQDVELKLGLYPYGDPDRFDGHEHTEEYPPGTVLANYVTQTGDQVLVDKITYNFRAPHRGEVFIFKTSGIANLTNGHTEDEGSQDFIKRCVGLAGDLIEVIPPKLLVQPPGEAKRLAEGAPAFAKEFAQADGYPGYSLVRYDLTTGVTGDPTRPFDQLDPNNNQTYYVPADCYWAMGDNSTNSDDSRYWGGVPRQNLIGRGYFVFWPFTKRWGWIR